MFAVPCTTERQAGLFRPRTFQLKIGQVVLLIWNQDHPQEAGHGDEPGMENDDYVLLKIETSTQSYHPGVAGGHQ